MTDSNGTGKLRAHVLNWRGVDKLGSALEITPLGLHDGGIGVAGIVPITAIPSKAGDMGKLKLTPKEIEAGRSKKGGFTRAQLTEWGVPWPPPHGWLKKLLAGEDIEPLVVEGSVIRPEESAHEILHQVVMAVINQGHARDLYDYPDVLAYFGAQNPETN